MYHKIHQKLTFLFTAVSGLILIVLSVCYLFTSEKELKSNNLLSFSNDMSSIIANLEQKNTITNEWLSKISSNSDDLIGIYDHSIPIHYTQTVLTAEQLALLETLRTTSPLENTSEDVSLSDYTSIHTEWVWHYDNQSYYACIGQISPSTKKVQLVILRPMAAFEHQLLVQRLRFLLIDLGGIVLLFLFSWFYTNRLLSPIQASQEKQNAFIASASHELRTPLAVIISSISSMKLADDGERMHFLSTIEAESRQMSVLVNDMLTLARADSHSWSFHPKSVELDTLLLELYESFLPLTEEKQLTLKLSLPEEQLPHCHCDPQRTSQVLSILLSNALSYTPSGGRICLSITCRSTGFYITVADNGIGISDAAKEHVFDRFYRGEPSRSQKEHFGLGLSIAREIMQIQKGSISVTDTADGGAAFTIMLPIC